MEGIITQPPALCSGIPRTSGAPPHTAATISGPTAISAADGIGQIKGACWITRRCQWSIGSIRQSCNGIRWQGVRPDGDIVQATMPAFAESVAAHIERAGDNVACDSSVGRRKAIAVIVYGVAKFHYRMVDPLVLRDVFIARMLSFRAI